MRPPQPQPENASAVTTLHCRCFVHFGGTLTAVSFPALPSRQVEEYKDQVFDLLNNGAHMYFCGLKGMMPGILEMLEGVCKEKGLNYEEWIEKLKHTGQWCGRLAVVRPRVTPPQVILQSALPC